ncbi:hypothetical protein LUZ63_011538 [Rhynchospora breviuscula]|uniref:F-box domain-containing protein n=1 Tax=Rhynchospora breviuscula TaxID=2022672 RepID=A0A9Q0CJ61_9POAL|nr:hypothetical protein LUZ63_011538 [Rhynchospora breviuscula]
MEGGEGAEGSSTFGRNWEELARDALILIFLKLGTMEVLRAAGSVCRSWRKVATEEPVLWRKINMIDEIYGPYGDVVFDPFLVIDPVKSARLAIDRSGGQLEEFAAAYFVNDDLLRYLCDRTNALKKLVLISNTNLSAEAISETAKRQPLLEEIEILEGPFSKKLTEIVGTACPRLKSFKLNNTFYDDEEAVILNDDEALGIAKTMHQLRHLELIGNRLTNEGLTAILDGCPHLETLDISSCFDVKMDDDMDARCARLKTVRSDYLSDSDGFDNDYGCEFDPAFFDVGDRDDW